jgi:DNA-binding NarL/FixJ family response regulator
VVGNQPFDLVLVDLLMPGMNGFEGIRLLRQHLDGVPLVVISSSEDPADIQGAFDNGARGYILKSSAADLLKHALPLVLAGEVFVPAAALYHSPRLESLPPTQGTCRPANGKIKVMTPRQTEVLKLLAKGQSNKEIARNLGMLDSTVKVHVKAILQKLGVKNRTQAVLAGIRQGHISNESIG